MLNKIAESCRFLLNNSPEAEPYLAYLNSRLSSEMQEKFCFGYFPGSENLNLLTNFVSEEDLKKIELIYTINTNDSAGHSSYQVSYFEHHPLIMPYKDVYGNVVGLVGRTILSDKDRGSTAKYKNTSFDKRNHVFGLYEAKLDILEKDCVYVVEGQFDVIKAREKGIPNIVALGNCNISPFQLSLICRYTQNIFLLLDSDNAGERARERIIEKYQQFANIVNIYLPYGYKDIDEYLKDNDSESLSFVMKNVDYSF